MLDQSANPTLERDGTVRQVRECGTEHAIPLGPSNSIDLASDVRVERAGGRWWIKAAANSSVSQNGVERREFELTPATEIRVGSSLYIAESNALIALRNVCRRLLGWGVDEQLEVDRAVRRIWLSVTHHTAIVLRGGGDLVAAARGIHRAVRGPMAPFVAGLFGERATVSVGSSLSRQIPVSDALQCATGGTLCLRRNPRSRELAKLASTLCFPASHTLLFICCQDRTWSYDTLSEIHVPRLARRIAELPRIVDEYARDSTEAHGVPLSAFGQRERTFVLRYHATSLSDIEMTVDRVVALSASSDIHDTAQKLHLDARWLARWARTRSTQ